jgi:hypothetical protein
MAYQTFLRFRHKADIYTRTVTTNNSGQKIAAWTLGQSGLPCSWQPVASERRVTPYTENVEEYEILVPHSYASYFDYGYRVQNIKDRYDNVLAAGPFEVVEILRRAGYSGKLSHILVRIRLAVEIGS